MKERERERGERKRFEVESDMGKDSEACETAPQTVSSRSSIDHAHLQISTVSIGRWTELSIRGEKEEAEESEK
jgi:hypothetical protein